MEIVTQILKHLPVGWPRIIALVCLGLLFFFPELRRQLTFKHQEKENLDRAKQLLELRKLELSVVELKARYPDATNDFIDGQLNVLFTPPANIDGETDPNPVAEKSLVWFERLKLAMVGSFGLMILGSIALWLNGKYADGVAAKAILIEFGIALFCGLVASALPCQYRWECVFRGFLFPAVLGALAIAALGNLST